jgi:hypothetical protein
LVVRLLTLRVHHPSRSGTTIWYTRGRVSSWRGNYLVRCDLDCHRRGKEQQQRTLLNLPPQQDGPKCSRKIRRCIRISEIIVGGRSQLVDSKYMERCPSG